MVLFVKEMVYLIPHYCVLGDLGVNKVSVGFLQQLALKNKYKTKVQLYLFGINGLIYAQKYP